MFDIGFGEMVLLAAIALIAIGPKQLPEVARTVGRVLRELKKAMGEVTDTMANAHSATGNTIQKIQDDLTKSVLAAPDARPINTNSTGTTEPATGAADVSSAANAKDAVAPLPEGDRAEAKDQAESKDKKS